MGDPVRAHKWQGSEYETAKRRVRKISTSELLEWADVASSAMGRGFSDYRSQDRVESLEEIRLATVTMAALVEELKARHEAGSG